MITKGDLYRYEFTLDRVVDGDTIVANIDLGFDLTMKDFVRLIGVDAPERREPTRVEGEQAKAFVQNWFWKRLGLIKDTRYFLDSRKFRPYDKYGRILGSVYAVGDPISLNEAIIEAGFGVKGEE